MYLPNSKWCVYITTCKSKTSIYTGSTNNIQRRLLEHYVGRGKKRSFTGRYFCYWLIYIEYCGSEFEARKREYEIKGWRREKKLALINAENPDWKFLNFEIFETWPPENLDQITLYQW